MVKIAGIQCTSTQNIETNIHMLTHRVVTAAENGAKLIVTPENSNIISLDRDILWQQLNTTSTDTFLQPFKDLAKAHNVWIHLGSVVVPVTDNKVANRAFMIDAYGHIVATYDKIHMFDVVLSDREHYKESDTVQAGTQAKVIKTPFGIYGFSICYDVRFAPLFTSMAKMGAEIIAIPAAFTDTTGQAHWDILTRSRAVETGCFVVAIGQTGTHQDGRTTYGHSRIIHPWGNKIAELAYEVGILYADIDITEVQKTRNRVPALANIVEFTCNPCEKS